jgi:hypothetical protein
VPGRLQAILGIQVLLAYLLVRAIAQGRVAGSLAGTEKIAIVFLRLELHRGKLSPLVRTVAKGLFLGTATGTPPHGVTGLKLDGPGLGVRDIGTRHGSPPDKAAFYWGLLMRACLECKAFLARRRGR